MLLTFLMIGGITPIAYAQKLEIPRRHDRPPGPPISAVQAVAKMSVPKDFHVEIVAEEPDIVNPVAMAIDEQGRFWVTESFEYPRREPGVGKDRIKVLEDTDQDGRVDKVTVFAEGLNIPSGIAVGHGGVWVANAPDLLFLEDTDGDLKADKTTTLLTGFGRTDTHELPNAFTWGPDGWLYGLNGVFNYCDVRYTKENPNYRDDHPGWKFTCVMWRLHPRTKEFQIYAEGTSNPWGIAINNKGDFFISACVIDHLWHITEGAYYIRQGGPYPPNTWPMRSIVDHKHQKAAYCGITYYDSDAYPSAHRNVLYMGNIHGGCINADIVDAKGSSYFGQPKPDFVTANDAWFMPVAQLTGRDGNLYLLDWYDQYHCYQDANADPEGVERAKGRLYRLVYDGNDSSAKKTRHKTNDLGALNDRELVDLLSSENGFERWTAQRLLSERSNRDTIKRLSAIVADETQSERTRLHALWTIGSMQTSDETIAEIAKLKPEQNVELYAWSIRLLGNAAATGNPNASQALQACLTHLDAAKNSAALSLDMLPAIAKCQSIDAAARTKALAKISGYHPTDATVQHVAYNLIRQVASEPSAFKQLIAAYREQSAFDDPAGQWVPLLLDWAVDDAKLDADTISDLVEVFMTKDPKHDDLLLSILNWTHAQSLERSETDALVSKIKQKCSQHALNLSNVDNKALSTSAILVLASWKNTNAVKMVEAIASNSKTNSDNRLAAIETLMRSDSSRLDQLLPKLLMDSSIAVNQRAAIIDTLGSLKSDEVPAWLAQNYNSIEQSFQSKVIEVLTQRPAWSKLILEQVAEKRIPVDRFNLNQLRRLATFKDESVQKLLREHFGSIRESNSEERVRVVNRMRDMLGGLSGDPFAGRAVFKRVCSQCHVLHGEGYNVGPDITRNGRNNWQQLIQNVFDPSAVIGPGFQAVVILTDDDRVLTGVPTEETEQSVTLKIQGGKLETIAKNSIEEMKRSDVSLMPEQIENQMTNQEAADLFAYLALDKPPEDSSAVLLPGAPAHQFRSKKP